MFENTHEAIVSQEAWELANRLRNNAKRHVDRLGAPRPLTGLLYCAQCGAKMYHDRSGPNAKKHKDFYTCSNYSTQHGTCTSHRVTTKTIEELILQILRKVIRFALNDEAKFTKQVTEIYSAKLEGDVKSRRKRLAVCEKRSGELDRLIKKLFEEHALGSMNDKRFDLLSTGYEKEQEELESEIGELRGEVARYLDGVECAGNFLELARRYRDLPELTPQMINEFVDKVLVHERADKGCQITKQKIEIHLNLIGDFSMPEEPTPDADAAQLAADAERAKRREYHRDYNRRRKENGGKPLSERTPEERAIFEAERKEKMKLYQREYQREWQRRKAAGKRAEAEAKVLVEAAGEAAASMPTPAA